MGVAVTRLSDGPSKVHVANYRSRCHEEKEIKKCYAIQDATNEIGYSSLREKQEEIMKHFLFLCLTN